MTALAAVAASRAVSIFGNLNWTGASFAEDVGNYHLPTTLVVGEGDPFVTNDYLATTLAELREGTMVNIAGAGHYPMVEQPEETVAIMEKAVSGETD